MDNQIFTTENPRETHSLGEKIGKTLKGGEILCLYGELGSGKTTFSQGISEGLEIKKRIVSPTFVFMREYPLEKGQWFYHIDCYRLEKQDEAKNLGISDLIGNKKNIIVIEWAERIEKILPKQRIDIKFENLEGDQRKIALEFKN